MAMRDLIPRGRSRSSVARSESVNPLAAFHDEMNRLFDDFWRGFDGFGSMPSFSFGYPHVEVSETDRELRVEAELPGMDMNDVEVLLHDGVLTLRGERKREEEDRSRRLSERYYGRFERQIAVPPEIDEEKVKASFEKGVLTVTLPKTAEAAKGVKRIPIAGK